VRKGKAGQSRNDQRSNSKNPTSTSYRAAANNRSNQLNPTSSAYGASRARGGRKSAGGGGAGLDSFDAAVFAYRPEALKSGWLPRPDDEIIVGLGGLRDSRRLGLRFACSGCSEQIYGPPFTVDLTSLDPSSPSNLVAAEIECPKCQSPYEIRMSGGLAMPRAQVFGRPTGSGQVTILYEYKIINWGDGENEY
jgi:hypothetical protein